MNEDSSEEYSENEEFDYIFSSEESNSDEDLSLGCGRKKKVNPLNPLINTNPPLNPPLNLLLNTNPTLNLLPAIQPAAQPPAIEQQPPPAQPAIEPPAQPAIEPAATRKRGRPKQNSSGNQSEPEMKKREKIEKEYEWVFKDNVPKEITFTPERTPGPQIVVNSFYEAFNLFLNDDLLTHIVKETEKYALVNAGKHLNLTVDELKKFLGILIYMSQIKKPEIDYYWSTDSVIATPIVSKTMSKNRYKLINRFLHFGSDFDPNDQIWGLRYVINSLKNSFAKYYELDREVSIDESLLKFKGRLRFKQYSSKKRARFGIKIHKLNDSKSGFCLNFKIFTGKEETDKDESKTKKVVYDILNLVNGKTLLDKGYILYLDSWYNSLNLGKSLLDRNTHCIGTFGKNKLGFPTSIDEKVIEKYESKSISSKKYNILVIHHHEQADLRYRSGGRRRGSAAAQAAEEFGRGQP